jgi:hypothetical protein
VEEVQKHVNAAVKRVLENDLSEVNIGRQGYA